MKHNRNQTNFLKDVEQKAAPGLDVGLQLGFDGEAIPFETIPTETIKETVQIFKQHEQIIKWREGNHDPIY